MTPGILITLPHENLLRAEGHRVRLLATLEALRTDFSLAFVLPRTCPPCDRTVLQGAPVYEFDEPRFLGLGFPYLVGQSSSFRNAVRRAVEEFRPHLLFADLPWGAGWLGQTFPEPLIHFSHGVERDFSETTLLNFRLNFFPFRPIAKGLTAVLEKAACVQADLNITMSSEDSARFSELYWIPPDRLFSLAQSVRLSSPFPEKSSSTRATLRRKYELDEGNFLCVFHGSWHHVPNRLAFEAICRRIAPRIGRTHPEVRFILAGTGLESFKEGNVHSLGFVETLPDLLRACDLAVLPILHGAGVRMKTFDFIAAGLPLVGTEKALEGVALSDGKEAFLSKNSIEDFLERLSGLFELEPELRIEAFTPIAEAAWRKAKLSHDSELLGAQLREELFQRFLPEYAYSASRALANS